MKFNFNQSLCIFVCATSFLFSAQKQDQFFITQQKSALQAFENSNYALFDAHVGDMMCQIRPLMLMHFFEKHAQGLLSVDDKAALTKMYILTVCRDLTQYSQGFLTFDYAKAQVMGVSKTKLQTYARDINKLSMSFITTVILPQLVDAGLKKSLQRIVCDAAGRQQCAFFPATKALLCVLIAKKYPLVLRCMIEVATSVRDVVQVQFNTVEQQPANTPVFIVEGAAHVASQVAVSAVRDRLQKLSCNEAIELILANSAVHPQFSSKDTTLLALEDEIFTDVRDEFTMLQNKAHMFDCVKVYNEQKQLINKPSFFSVNHVFCESHGVVNTVKQ